MFFSRGLNRPTGALKPQLPQQVKAEKENERHVEDDVGNVHDAGSESMDSYDEDQVDGGDDVDDDEDDVDDDEDDDDDDDDDDEEEEEEDDDDDQGPSTTSSVPPSPPLNRTPISKVGPSKCYRVSKFSFRYPSSDGPPSCYRDVMSLYLSAYLVGGNELSPVLLGNQ